MCRGAKRKADNASRLCICGFTTNKQGSCLPIGTYTQALSPYRCIARLPTRAAPATDSVNLKIDSRCAVIGDYARLFDLCATAKRASTFITPANP
jgi:hypothetical protein